MKETLLLLYLGGSSIWDWRTGRIPNRWQLCWAGILGLEALWPPWTAGAEGPLTRLGAYAAGALLCLLLFFPFYLFRMFGAGDIKTVSLLCGAAGVLPGLGAVLCGLGASALWSFFRMARKRLFKKRVTYFLNYLKRLPGAEGIPAYYVPARDGAEPAFCMVPFLFLGFCLWMAKGGAI